MIRPTNNKCQDDYDILLTANALISDNYEVEMPTVSSVMTKNPVVCTVPGNVESVVKTLTKIGLTGMEIRLKISLPTFVAENCSYFVFQGQGRSHALL